MKILIYSFNDKIGDGLQKVTFIQTLKSLCKRSHITYTTSQKSSLKNQLNPFVENCIDRFIEHNNINSSLFDLPKRNKIFNELEYDLIIDLQKVVIRTLKLKKIKHKKFFSASANFLFSDYKNIDKKKFKNVYIERFYFNILEIIFERNIIDIPNIKIPHFDISKLKIQKNVKKNIAIAPGAGDKIRRWPFKNYLEIAKILRNKGYNVYFFLGPEEKYLLKQCNDNNFECPEWKNGKMITKDLSFIMNIAKKMCCLLANDGGTSWMFEFAGVKTLKIFGVTSAKKFSRPGYSKSIEIKDFNFKILSEFSIKHYKPILFDFLNTI